MKRRVLNFFAATAVSTLFLTQAASAADVSWTCGDGLWQASSCWSAPGEPQAGDTVFLNQPGANITYSLTTAQGLSNLILNGSNLDISGGSLSAAFETIGDFANGGTGQLNQTGGANTIGERLLVTNGSSYNLGGGILSAVHEDVFGAFSQTGGSHSINSGLYLNTGGTYSLTDGTLNAGSEDVFRGIFLHTGGTNTVNNELVIYGTVSAQGSYTLSGPSDLTAGAVYIGSSGIYTSTAPARAGIFTQSGGTNTILNGLYLGYNTSSSGSYGLSGGSVTALNEYVGYYGVGSFSQIGGTNAVSNGGMGTLYLGYSVGSSGTYELSGTGVLGSERAVIGVSGSGTFTQTGGTYHALFGLTIGSQATSSGVYDLSGGALETMQMTVGAYGSGVFNHTGGTNTNEALRLGTRPTGSGVYNLSGAGVLSTADVFIGGGAMSGMGSYNSTILAGQGRMEQSGGTHIANNLFVGYSAGSTGVYNLSAGSVSAVNEYVGYSGQGSFNQTGGTHNVGNELFVGYSPGITGAYELSAGSLSAVNEYIGYSGQGSFGQTGGMNNVSNELFAGYNAGSTGSYNLSAGEVSALNEYVGYSGNGVFSQTGGTHTVSNGGMGTLYLGYNAGSSGTYELSGTGALASERVVIGVSGSGAFTQTGGTHNALTGVTIGSQATSSGVYNLNGGALETMQMTVGQYGSGVFNHTGGTNSVEALRLGTRPTGSGVYNLSNVGTLSTADSFIGGGAMSGMGSYNSTILAGQGRMEQSGGTHTANNLFVGYSTGSTGVYNLSAGAVSAVNEYVGYSGQGSFNQTGGSNILSDTLLIGSQGVYNLGGGVLNAGSVVNNGTFNYSGGQLNSGAIINNVGGNFNFNDANFNVSGDVTNYGTVKTNNATVNFTGTFTNYGAYISDPSSNYFSNIVVGADGYLVGGIGDNFYLTGDFLNYSTQTALWNTADAYIGFIGSGTHEFYMGGWDDASRMSFAWDTLELSGGGSLVFSGGAGSAIYVDNLILGADAIMDLNGIAIYYASLTDLGGSYYGGNVVNIASLPQGGNASVPEPSTLLLLGSGVAALFGWRRARGRLH